TEAGGQATFTVVLNSQPTANVTVGLSSSDTAEGTVGPTSIVFTSLNWNAPQTVTVTGVDDAAVDGNQPYTIVTAAAVSTDAGYSGVNAVDVAVTNTDNDTAGITVAPIAGLTTTEAGGQATFTVVLNSQPSSTVTIGLTSSDTAEGTVSPASLVFTNANWNAPQTVTVTGVNDAAVDGNQPYTIITAAAVSSDAGYSTRNAADVAVTNTDNDTAGIIVSPIGGLTTSEGGATATYAIVLQSQPSFDVTVPISTNDATEGTVSPTSVTFTSVNWNAPQVITITGVNDAVADGNQVYSINNGTSVSADPAYNGLNPTNVAVTNIDNDSPGIAVTPTSGLITTESGATAEFTIVLNSQPTADVTIDLSSSDVTEGTITQTTVTFTAANWNSAQTITVTGVNDAVADGNQPFTIVTDPATSGDAGYNGVNALDVGASNIDNDSASIIVTPVSGLVTTEAGGSALFTVQLGSQPTSDVTIALTSSDTTEGTVIPTSLVFTAANWNLTQTVTVTGVNDAITDGGQLFTVVTAPATSGDAGYNNLDAANVTVTNLDDDIPGFTLDPTGGLFVSEFGDFDTFTIVLNTQPAANVTINLSSSDTTEGAVSPTSVTFTSANWNVPQTVTVTGVNDVIADGSQSFFVVTSPAVSTDLGYNGLNPPDVDVTNFDDDSPGVFIKARRLLRTSENGQGSTFRVRLTTQPSADVTCTFSSSDTTEGVVAPTTLVFTAANFAVSQNVTVSGVDDAVIDGDQLFSMISSPCTSADPNYSGFDPRDLAVINRDND
ncbi:MAG: calcium-binding protein, partial [Deltaproteobacteria bacterium]|nr:calcium-binding protein [Deltaproteobacteria bacterium]